VILVQARDLNLIIRDAMINHNSCAAPGEPMKNAPYSLAGQVALITGSSKGIGKACAIALAEAGADIVLGLHDINSARALIKQIEKLGRKVLAVQMDVSNLKQISSAVATAHKHFKRIDILVNNTGIGAASPAEDVSEHDFDATVAVNLKGTFFVSQAVGRIMIKQR
jgi:NAD(P)-dependent dehydrogenase (short-subunit alcohol dehydrogenase family)